jgi:prenylcysteine oxidase/farnesylcysteine lyase
MKWLWPLLIWITSHCYAVAALQIHFNFPFFSSFSSSSSSSSSETVLGSAKPRIAIVGAGAAGSSAAFWISKAKERFAALDVDVDVYERASYVGGRESPKQNKKNKKGSLCFLLLGTTTVYPYGNRSLSPIEIGATIFVRANKNLWRASEEFNLTRRKFGMRSTGLGIWDGRQFLLTVRIIDVFPFCRGSYFLFSQLKNDDSIMDMLRIFWRYGAFSPYKVNKMYSTVPPRCFFNSR